MSFGLRSVVTAALPCGSVMSLFVAWCILDEDFSTSIFDSFGGLVISIDMGPYLRRVFLAYHGSCEHIHLLACLARVEGLRVSQLLQTDHLLMG